MEWAGDRPPESGHAEGLAFGRWLGRDLPPAARVERVLAGEGRLARDAGGIVVRLPWATLVLGSRGYRGFITPGSQYAARPAGSQRRGPAGQRDEVTAGADVGLDAEPFPGDARLEVGGEEPVIGPGQDTGSSPAKT